MTVVNRLRESTAESTETSLESIETPLESTETRLESTETPLDDERTLERSADSPREGASTVLVMDYGKRTARRFESASKVRVGVLLEVDAQVVDVPD